MQALIRILAFILLFAAIGNASAKEEVVSAAGTFNVYTEDELRTKLRELNTGNLPEETKQSVSTILNSMIDMGAEYHRLQGEKRDFDHVIKNQSEIISKLEGDLIDAEKRFAIREHSFEGVSEGDLNVRLSRLSADQQAAQNELTRANADFLYIQTLPSRAPNMISASNARIQELNNELAKDGVSALQKEAYLLEIYNLEKEASLTQERLLSQATLEDISNYTLKIKTLELNFISDYIKQIQTYQNLQVSKGHSEAGLSEDLARIPELGKELATNDSINSYLKQRQEENALLSQDLISVEDALGTVRQIDSNLEEQVDAIGRSLVLSKLLSRQQSEIPVFKTRFDLNELIPDLNIWIYDLRRFRDELFNTQEYADTIIRRNPHLRDYRKELESIIKQRRALYDDLYSALSNAHTVAIDLKFKYQEYLEITGHIRKEINDQLFWIASNQALGINFFNSMVPLLRIQVNSIIDNMRVPSHWYNTLHSLLVYVLPVLIAGIAIKLFMHKLKNFDNRLALRLDRRNDTLWNTPVAFCNRFLMIIPRVSWIIVLIAIFVYMALDNSDQQITVMMMIALHITVFVFYIDLLKPNSFAQRHFCLSETRLNRQRNNIDRIYKAVIPILIVANFREIDPTNISSDILGYLIILVATLYLIYISITFIMHKYRSEGISIMEGIAIVLFVILPILLFIMLATGYYYTAVKIINRLAFSFYIFLGYIIVSNMVRRGLYVAELRIVTANQRMRAEKAVMDVSTLGGGVKPTTTGTLQDKIENLRMELINSKASKLINTVLLAICLVLLYLLWHDLASVMGYLDTIVLISSKTIVDGKEVVENVLTMANIFAFVFIIIVAAILNRNLPSLLERIFMIKATFNKSTSYTVKILTSYTIIALGIIFAAGSLGISWDDLQWLVAALSVGLGFGLQEIFANFVSGLIILFERQIRVGDIITLNGLSGTVNKIRIRSTTIISFDNKEVMIPNREFITSPLTNWSLSNSITMLEFSVGVAYDANVALAKDILTNIIRHCEYISKEEDFRVYVKELDDSAVTIMCEVYVREIGKRKTTTDYLAAQTLKMFAREGIQIPFKQVDIKIKNLDTGAELKVADAKA